MNDLVKAARDALELIEKIDTAIYSTDEVVGKLRAAVELAEKQEAVGFDEWFEKQLKYPTFEQTWNAAQQAERERIKDVIAELLDPKDPWIHYLTLLEKIDE